MGSTEVVTPPEATTSSPAPRRMGNWRSLVLSMALVLAVVLVWLALVPRPARIERPAVDVAAKARQVSLEGGPAVSGLGVSQGWRPTSVSWERSEEGLPTWQVGYHQEPDAQVYVTVQQTRLAAGADRTGLDAWVKSAVRDGTAEGTQQIAGVAWERFVFGSNPVRRSLVLRGSQLGSVSTVLTGNASFEELGALAGSLRAFPVAPRSVTPSPNR